MFNLNQFIYNQVQTPKPVTRSENMAAYYITENTAALPRNDWHECLLDGTSYHSSFRPNSDDARTHLSYIEGFILSKNRENYFVRRKENMTYLLLFTYDGEGYLEYEGQKIVLKKGDGILIDCRIPHFYKTNKTYWTHFDLHINGYFVQKVYEYLREYGQYTFSQPVEGIFQNHLEELVELYNDVNTCRELLISNKLNSLLSFLLVQSENYQKNTQGFPETLRYLISYINSNYMRELPLAFLSEFSCISTSHLIRLFHTYLHCSPGEYIIQVRLENAKQLLINTALPANKIGAMVGIDNENYFRHLFKSRVGITPKQYRQGIS